MIRFTSVINGDEYVNQKIKEKSVSVIDAINAYNEGKRIAINMGDRFYILDKATIFQTDFDYLVNASYIILP